MIIGLGWDARPTDGQDFDLDASAFMLRNDGEWKFKAVGQGYAGGLTPLARNFGINI